MVSTIIQNIIDENYTDGIVCKFGKPGHVKTECVGIISNEYGLPINDNTLFDLASVTKILSLVTIFKLIEEGFIELEKPVGYYSDRFLYMKNLHIYELMNFSCSIVTDRRIDTCSSRVEALELLYNAKPKLDSAPQYSDIGIIVLVELINIIGNSDTFYYEYSKHLWDSIGMNNTYWWFDIPKNMYPVTQCYDFEYRFKSNHLSCIRTPLGQVHDKKAATLSVAGHAGVYSTADDMVKFTYSLINGELLNPSSIDCIISSNYDSYNGDQHYGLLCYKKAKTEKKSEVPFKFSDESIAMSGYTGTHLLIDFKNKEFIFIGANRINERLTYSDIDVDQDLSIESFEKIRGYSIDYVYRKDEIVRYIER